MSAVWPCGCPKTAANIVIEKGRLPHCRECKNARRRELARMRGRGERMKTRIDQPLAERILLVVAQATGSSVDFLLCPRRWREVTLPRQAVMYALRKHGFSYPAIGEMLGRDHSTIISGINTASTRMANDEDYARLVRKAIAA